MEKQKKITDTIISAYMDFLSENHQVPVSIQSFCKTIGINEAEFYEYFTSFESIEKRIYVLFFENTINLLDKNESYKTYTAQNKLLSFYYTFFENLTANRSYVVFNLEGDKHKLKSIAKLSELRLVFKKYIATLEIEKIDLMHEKANQFQEKSTEEFFWFQFLFTLKFWLDDTSLKFEKTDVFIEKSINTTFDVMDTKPLKSIIDLGKFIFKEKMNF